MSARIATVRARIDPELKQEVESILEEMGLTSTALITMLYRCIARERDIPFSLHVPNELTQRVIEEARAGVNLLPPTTVAELRKKYG